MDVEKQLKYGFVFPGGDARTLAGLAREAEDAGWDAVFVPDCIYIEAGNSEVEIGYDPWVVMSAIAMATERVRIGPMLTPISRRRPWKLARETVTLDHLSGGRLVLSVGLGALEDAGFGKVGEATDRKTRAQMLDEGLAIVAGLWSGEPFSFDGQHYHVKEMTFQPKPVQSPRIPVWVVGAWPRKASMERVLRWDGLLPNKMNERGEHEHTKPDDIAAMKAYIEEHRHAGGPFDIVFEGETPGHKAEQAAAKVRPYAEAGITWWLESMWSPTDGLRSVRERVLQGPPRL